MTLPEPEVILPYGKYIVEAKMDTPTIPLFTAAQMIAFRDAALEEAAKVADEGHWNQDIAWAIRELKGTT
jgi:hypothetical protein